MSAENTVIVLGAVDNSFCIMEELLDLRNLKGTASGKDIVEAVSDAIVQTGLQWDKLSGVTTDGAPGMTGEHKRMPSMI